MEDKINILALQILNTVSQIPMQKRQEIMDPMPLTNFTAFLLTFLSDPTLLTLEVLDAGALEAVAQSLS